MPSSPPGDADSPRLICRCLGVSSLRIAEAIRVQGLTQVAEIQQALRAGSGCYSCHPEIEELLAEARGEPISAQLRSQNRALCQSETQRQIEGALYGGIVPKLPAGSRVEIIWVEGLQLELQVTPELEAELRALITDKLRKVVCPDLEVVFRRSPSR